MTLPISIWNISLATYSRRVNLWQPKGVIDVNRFWIILTNKYLLKAITFINLKEVFCTMKICTNFPCGRKLKRFPFYSCRDRDICIKSPLVFSMIALEFTLLFCFFSLTGLMMRILVILSSSAFNLFFFNAKWIFLRGVIHQGNWMINSYGVRCAQSSNFTKNVLIFSKKCW